MLESNLYIGIPIGAFCSFLFMFFSFLNAPKARPVTCFRMILGSCLLWTGSVALMRLQAAPGMEFWFHVSLAALLLIPVFVYFFLFTVLGIRLNGMLFLYGLITVAAVIVNSKVSIIMPPPKAVINGSGYTVIVYQQVPGAYVTAVLEVVMLVYVTVLAHRRIGSDLFQRERLVPFLIGTLCVFFGNFTNLIPGNEFPYDALGGVLMAFCFVFVLYKQYVFDVSKRLTIGCIYSLAVIIILLPVWNLAGHVEQYAAGFHGGAVGFMIIGTFICAWSVFVILAAHRFAVQLLEKRRRKVMDQLQKFQRETASLFNRRILYRKLIESIDILEKKAEAVVFETDDAGKTYRPVSTSRHKPFPNEQETEVILEKLNEPVYEKKGEITFLRYDDEIKGFLYLKFPDRTKLNFDELKFCQQLCAYASICMKNISIYESVYQISIHDELTGLYNRTYCREFLAQEWNPKKPHSLIYLNLDDFKLFNELYGVNCGDAILKWCGSTIKEMVGDFGTVFRVGSNEYLIVSGCDKREELMDMAKRIQDRIAQEDEKKPRVMQPITFSIGISIYPGSASSMDELLKQAERASFYAKRNGKNRVEIYEVGIGAEEEEDNAGGYEQIAPTVYALLAAIDAKDSYTFEHSCHVSEYAVLLAGAVGLSGNEIQIVKEAGLLHDIGKIGIPDNILKKQGRLTGEEFEIMKGHVQNSIEMIHFLPNMSYVIPAVVSHHERYDGSGYPRGLKGEEIPYLGRILAVCDSFDAITTKRAYKDAMTIDFAVSELEKNRGTQFDPELADAFVRLIREGKIMI